MRYLGQTITFLQQDDRNQESNQGCLGDVSQVQAGTDIEKLSAQTSTPAIRRSDNSDVLLRIRNMETQKRARENDTVDATKCYDSSFKKKKIHKDRETRK